MRAVLYAVPGSHPSLAAELMLRHKGVEVRRVDLVTVAHRGILRALGFPGATVPAVRLDGLRLQGTRTISRALDALRPEPRLFPADAERRLGVERAEAWGDEVLQPVARRLGWWVLRRDRSAVRGFLEGARTGLPTGVVARLAPPVVRAAARLGRATDAAVRADLAALPGLFDRVDRLVAEGVLAGPEPNAADFQIATSVRLLTTFDDLEPALAGRPAARLALDVVPDLPGRFPTALPPDWLVPLRRAPA